MSLIKFLFYFCIVSFSATICVASEIYLSTGQTHSMSDAGDETVHVRGRKIINVEKNQNQIVITALSIGEAQLRIGGQSYKIFVVHKNQNGFFSALKNLLSRYIGLQASNENGQIVVSGVLYRLSDWQAIYNLSTEFNSPYLFTARIDPDVQEPANKWILLKIAEKGLHAANIDFQANAKVYLATEEQKQSEHWAQTLQPFGLTAKYEDNQVAIAPLVRVRIVVAEVNKKLQSQLGVEWPEMISASVVPSFKGPTSLEVFLKAMEQNGLGQILASPNLLARSGSEADFLAGGEFAIKILTSRSREVIWKKHGIYLKIKPRADRLGHLNIELSTEVSLIDPSQSVDGVPGLKTNRMNTHFDLNQARTIVLSGLIRTDWGKSTNGISGLSKIPVLGSLFRSEDFHNNRSELVIFVTPEIVKENSAADQNLMPASWSRND